MADDPKTPEPPKEEAPKVEMIPKSKYDEQAQLIAEYKATLKAFEVDRQRTVEAQRRQPPPGGTIDDLTKAIASELGVSPDDVKPHLKMFDIAFGAREQQYLGILNTLADKIDDLETRTTYPDYKDYADDITKERQSRVDRQLPWISRSEAYDIVRGRKLPEILAKEREKTRETDDLPADLGGTTSVTKAGPTPTGARRPSSAADLTAMTPADRLKLLEDLGEF